MSLLINSLVLSPPPLPTSAFYQRALHIRGRGTNNTLFERLMVNNCTKHLRFARLRDLGGRKV